MIKSVFVSGVLVGALLVFASTSRPAAQPAKGGYIFQHDADIQKAEPGTHNGGGQTIGYSFFDKMPEMRFVFRKRALKPGSGVGYKKLEDEFPIEPIRWRIVSSRHRPFTL